MPVERVDGPSDPRVAEYRNLPEPELVRVRGLFIAEGRIIVRRLIEDGRHRFRSVLVNEAAQRDLEDVLSSIADSVPVYVCDGSDFRGITGHDIHRGCLALVERPIPCLVDPLLAVARTVVVLEAVANADNVGGVFRNAAAFDVDAVLLSPTCCDPCYRKAIRTSMAATLRVPFARLDEWPEGLRRLGAHGFTIVALTPGQSSQELDVFAAEACPRRLALLVGAEGAGLTREAEALADVRVRIPMRAGVDSLNLAVATGIALYRLAGRQGREGRAP
jgi:tRNA G18 (ribose-2'-O)-methylase SpoU